MEDISLAGIRRLLIKNGADRVSTEACEALRDALQIIGADIASSSVKYAQHANRKTVKAEDVILAAE